MTQLISTVVLACTITVLTVITFMQEHKITTLYRACVPAETGGGVIQCTQPNIIQTHSKVVRFK